MDHFHLSLQVVLRIVWNFVYKLDEVQCKQFVAISRKTDHTASEYDADCGQVCTLWIWDDKHIPKLGNFKKVVEMDKSFFFWHTQV